MNLHVMNLTSTSQHEASAEVMNLHIHLAARILRGAHASLPLSFALLRLLCATSVARSGRLHSMCHPMCHIWIP